MQPTCTDHIPAAAIPTSADMRRIWKDDRCVQDSSAHLYELWIRRFRTYCVEGSIDERTELTREGVRRFIEWYARRRHREARHLSSAQSAIYALNRVYQVMGLNPPAWQRPPPVTLQTTTLLQAYADHLVRVRGSPPSTVLQKLGHIGKMHAHLEQKGKGWEALSLPDVDEFLVDCTQRYAPSTTAGIASSLRAFARYLHCTGRISVDLAPAVVAPVRRRYEHPPRALPWEAVQRLLQAVDTSSARGLRDHALLLLMSTYGFGAGEVIGLQLEDINWNAGTLKVRRPKTGVAFTLPLLAAVAQVLARYLQDGRPPHAPTRHLFLQARMPFGPLGSSSAVRHILIKHARAAGIDAPYLGSHVLRHSVAARHLDGGTSSRMLSDLLGHRDPESVSAYVRIATESLRELSLPIPT